MAFANCKSHFVFLLLFQRCAFILLKPNKSPYTKIYKLYRCRTIFYFFIIKVLDRVQIS